MNSERIMQTPTGGRRGKGRSYLMANKIKIVKGMNEIKTLKTEGERRNGSSSWEGNTSGKIGKKKHP